MIQILHGDHQLQVHQALVKKIEVAKQSGAVVVRKEAKGITLSDLEQAIATDELFVTKKYVVIDGLLSLPKGKAKEGLVSWVAKRSDDPSIEVVLVELKQLTATQLKPFSGAKVLSFPLPKVLFTWLENIGLVRISQSLDQFHEAIAYEDVQFCFLMLVRQVRLLIAFKDDGSFTGPPFLRAKMGKQADKFSMEKLLRMHARLLAIDQMQKTSTSPLDLAQEIDLFILEL